MRVNVVCRNWQDDRVLPRFARYLADRLGWILTPAPIDCRLVDAYYLMGYFERQVCGSWPLPRPTASLFTHREENEPKKTALYDEIAAQVALRVAMCRLYAAPLESLGPTMQAPLPLEVDRFVIAPHRHRPHAVVGLSGYTYKTRRKGEDLTAAAIASPAGRRVEWRGSGRGWPVPMRRYAWREMPAFYQGLDVLVCPSRVEGGPMPVLEALACGVPVVVPSGVGVIDEIPNVRGIIRYRRGDAAGLVAGLELALAVAASFTPADREALRASVAGHDVDSWSRAHARAFEGLRS